MSITANIVHAAQIGAVDLDAIETRADVAIAAKFSGHFDAAIRGIDADAVWKAIEAAKVRGKRTFRSGCGLWLTDLEFAA